MPAETHQGGRPTTEDDVLSLLYGLLDDPAGGEETTLAEVGIDEAGVALLWDAVCEEFAERSLAPELDPELVDPAMTLRATARTMAALLRATIHGRN